MCILYKELSYLDENCLKMQLLVLPRTLTYAMDLKKVSPFFKVMSFFKPTCKNIKLFF